MQEQAWKISRGQGTCVACGKGFESGEEHLAALSEAPEGTAPPAEAALRSDSGSASPDEEDAGNWLRYDFCKSCWTVPGQADWLAYWTTSWEPPSAARRPFNRQTAIDVFRRTGNCDPGLGPAHIGRTHGSNPGDLRPACNPDSPGVEPCAEARDEQRIRLRYVLALMLMRKRVLRFADSERGGAGRLMLRESDGTQHQVEVPPIAAGDADALSEEIARIMGW